MVIFLSILYELVHYPDAQKHLKVLCHDLIKEGIDQLFPSRRRSFGNDVLVLRNTYFPNVNMALHSTKLKVFEA